MRRQTQAPGVSSAGPGAEGGVGCTTVAPASLGHSASVILLLAAPSPPPRFLPVTWSPRALVGTWFTATGATGRARSPHRNGPIRTLPGQSLVVVRSPRSWPAELRSPRVTMGLSPGALLEVDVTVKHLRYVSGVTFCLSPLPHFGPIRATSVRCSRGWYSYAWSCPLASRTLDIFIHSTVVQSGPGCSLQGEARTRVRAVLCIPHGPRSRCPWRRLLGTPGCASVMAPPSL